MIDFEFVEIVDNVLDLDKYINLDVDLLRWAKILISTHLIYDEELDGYITDEVYIEKVLDYAFDLLWGQDDEKKDFLMDEFNLYEEALEYLELNSYNEEELEAEFRDMIDFYLDNL